MDEEDGSKRGILLQVDEVQSVEASHRSALPLEDDVQQAGKTEVRR